ncbi:hypothetical protein [Colwellia sp. MB3u-70]|nr:hypothetical protein [Colwellia sp. MB3u-70]
MLTLFDGMTSTIAKAFINVYIELALSGLKTCKSREFIAHC